MEPLDIRRAGYQYKPVMDRVPRHQTIRERAEFLAHEIFADRLVPEEELADAIEAEILRFAKRVLDIDEDVDDGGGPGGKPEF